MVGLTSEGVAGAANKHLFSLNVQVWLLWRQPLLSVCAPIGDELWKRSIQIYSILYKYPKRLLACQM
jgi:hypothetical protein